MKKHYLLSTFLLLCASLNFAQKDIGIPGILNPDVTQDLPYNFNDSIKVWVINIGPEALMIGDTISIVVSATPQNINLTQDSIFVLRLPITQQIPAGTLFGAFSPPISLAPFLGLFIGVDVEFCFKANLDTDVDIDLSTNTYCALFRIVDPAVEPNSVQTLQDEALSINYINNQLILNKKPAGSILNVYNILGERVFSNSSSQMTYSLNLNTGIYIAQLENGQKVLKTVKILVP